MDERLLSMLTGAALAGIAARPNGGHGIPARSAEELGREAVELAKAATLALEAELSDTPKAKPKGR